MDLDPPCRAALLLPQAQRRSGIHWMHIVPGLVPCQMPQSDSIRLTSEGAQRTRPGGALLVPSRRPGSSRQISSARAGIRTSRPPSELSGMDASLGGTLAGTEPIRGYLGCGVLLASRGALQTPYGTTIHLNSAPRRDRCEPPFPGLWERSKNGKINGCSRRDSFTV